MWARLLKSSNRFTAYSSDPHELKLGRIIPNITPHNRPGPDLSFTYRGRLHLQIHSQLTVLIRLN